MFSRSQALSRLEMNIILLNRDGGDKREGCTTPGGVMEYGVVRIT
jgi:hypothetical protein